MIRGVASYRERMELPTDAIFEATLQDISRADTAAEVIARTRIDPAGQPPFRFEISYEAAQLKSGHTYAIRAQITRGGQLLFTTDRHYPLPPPGQQSELLLVRAQQQASQTASTAMLENTYWKLMRLGNDTVTVGAEQREPHLVLHSAGLRVAGFGGCNRMTGSYTTSGENLTFLQMAGTMMACPEGMEYESAFHDALGKVAQWRVDGETWNSSTRQVRRWRSLNRATCVSCAQCDHNWPSID